MKQLLEADKAGLPVPPDQQAALEAAKQLEGLRQAKDQTGMGFGDFCGQVTQDPNTAKQMNDLWLIYSAGGSTSGKASLRNRPASEIQITVPAAPAPEQPQAPETPSAPVQPESPETPESPADGQIPEQPQLPELPPPEASAPETPEEPAVPEETTDPEEPREPTTPAEEAPAETQEPEAFHKGQMSARLVVYENLDEDDSD